MALEEEQRDALSKEMMYRTKVIKFLGRTTPIILQNENGPCPLLAICNVLLLKNQLTLSPDVAEVSQQKLLGLIAERLIDSNSNVNDKDMGFLENQQQNIADAIDLLPLLATGIDVNTKFRRIDDFEFTRECTIFDLLDIPLYHGWIVDPQDTDTANAIGSKSYNTLMEELVSLETRNQDHENNYEDDSVDFAAATAATLGVPSPSLSRGISFDDPSKCVPDLHMVTESDMEEKPEKLGVLELSEGELQVPSDDIKDLSIGFNESVCLKMSDTAVITEELGQADNENQKSYKLDHQITDHNAFNNSDDKVITQETACEETVSSKIDEENNINVSSSEKTVTCEESKDTVVIGKPNNFGQRENMEFESTRQEATSSDEFPSTSDIEDHASKDEQLIHGSNRDEHIISNGQKDLEATELSAPVAHDDLDSLGDRSQHIELPNVVASSIDREPIYEGEECILDSTVSVHEDREPIYEGEVVLAEQVEKSTGDDDDKESSMNKITSKQGELIRNFLDSNASQLTIFGLFFLQEGLKERELGVFFRNNHFNTMFKFAGELYILATDQGYINQPDLVWEKLNEVNGNTVFMTGDFKEFRIEERSGSIWDEQNAVTNTTDYLASIDKSAQDNSSFNSDLQLAIALQQQELEQQQQQQQRNVQQQQQTVSTNSSRLITGPQVARSGARSSHVSSRPEPKQSKEKCSIM